MDTLSGVMTESTTREPPIAQPTAARGQSTAYPPNRESPERVQPTFEDHSWFQGAPVARSFRREFLARGGGLFPHEKLPLHGHPWVAVERIKAGLALEVAQPLPERLGIICRHVLVVVVVCPVARGERRAVLVEPREQGVPRGWAHAQGTARHGERSRLPCREHELTQFVLTVGESREDRHDQHIGADARRAESRHGPQPCVWRGAAWLELP